MKVCILAFSVNGAMGQYLHCWLSALGRVAEVTLVAPSHYPYPPEGYGFTSFATGKAKLKAASGLLNPALMKFLARQISSCKPDALHLFNGEIYPGALFAAHRCSRTGVPLVTTIHDVVPHSGDRLTAALAPVRRFVLKRSDMVHVHSERQIKPLSGLGVAPAKIRVVPHGSFAPLYLPYLRNQPSPATRARVLFFGRIESYKGLDTLVSSASYLPEDVQIVIAGPGRMPEGVDVQALSASRFEIHNRYLDDAEVVALFQSSRACVMPYKDCTQSSLPLLSAALGVPVVGTAVGGLVDDIPKVNGILVSPNDPKSLAAGIVECMQRVPHYPRELEFEALAPRFAAMYQELPRRSRR